MITTIPLLESRKVLELLEPGERISAIDATAASQGQFAGEEFNVKNKMLNKFCCTKDNRERVCEL